MELHCQTSETHTNRRIGAVIRFRSLRKDDGSKTYQNLHRGARAFADGLYTAIRNPGMHMPTVTDGGEEQLALEQLAAFSLLARWVDQAAVEKA